MSDFDLTVDSRRQTLTVSLVHWKLSKHGVQVKLVEAKSYKKISTCVILTSIRGRRTVAQSKISLLAGEEAPDERVNSKTAR